MANLQNSFLPWIQFMNSKNVDQLFSADIIHQSPINYGVFMVGCNDVCCTGGGRCKGAEDRSPKRAATAVFSIDDVHVAVLESSGPAGSWWMHDICYLTWPYIALHFSHLQIRTAPWLWSFYKKMYNMCACDWSRMHDWPAEQVRVGR